MIVLFLIFVFLVLRFTVTLFNFISNPKLPLSARHYKDFVSILVPASKNSNVLNLLHSIEQQDYDNYEVLILLNSSEPLYGAIEHMCRTNPKFRLLKGEELPRDWQPRNFACHQLAREARGQYLMFLDPGDTMKRGLINSSLSRMKYNKLTLLSLFANQEMQTLGERMVVPLIHFLLLNLLPLRLVRISRSTSFAAASAHFMLFDADNYRQHEWHAEVRNKVASDIEIMRLVKGYSYNGETLLANGFITCREYSSYRDALGGVSESFLAGFGNSVPGVLLYLFLVLLGPLAVCFYMGFELILFGVTLIVLTRLMISFASGQNPWLNLILHPLQMFSLLLVAVLAIQKHFVRPLAWRDRKMGELK